MRKLALHQITCLAEGPEGLIKIARANGLNSVCLFTASPMHEDGSPMFPVVAKSDKIAFRKLLADHAVTIVNAEYFPVMPDQDVGVYEPSLELAVQLGAKRVVTHIHDDHPGRAEQQLGKLCEIAGTMGLEVGLEFTGFAAGCNSLEAAIDWHRRLQRSNLSIAVDALHLFRTGGTLAQLKAVDPAIIGYAQICDGAHFERSDDYVDEAMNRMIPGEGVFPLRKFVSLLGVHVDIDIEVPWARSPDAAQWAARAAAASQNLIAPSENRNDD